MPAPIWTPILRLDELAPGSLRPARVDGHRLVVARTAAGEVHALDDRCPHEGYPLVQGELSGCTLTCRWHNWKFDVRDGACTLGGEDARAYPTRVVDGRVEVDLAEPDPAALSGRWLASLLEGVRRHENGRAIRDGVRLLHAGHDPRALLVELAIDDAHRAEYGTTHVLPVAADCARLLGRYAGPDAMYAIAPALDLCGETNHLLPPRQRPSPVPGGGARELREAVEAEDARQAEALLLGAFDAGVPRAEIEGWLAQVLSDHFLDFGHQLIYLVKGSELLEHATDAAARDVYGSLVVGIVYGTREDTLPYLEPYARRLRAIEEELDGLRGRSSPDARLDGPALRRAVLDGSREEACAALWDALRGGVPPERIAGELVVAAAVRLARFDAALDARGEVAENWLWATHRFTYTAAVRHAIRRWERPGVLRLLFHALAFVHSGRPMDGAPVDPEPEPSTVAGVLEAVAARDPERAVARTLGFLASGEPIDALREAVEDACLADPAVRPIVVAHAIKTSFAAFEEHAALAGHPHRAVVLTAAVRFLASPVVERRVRETVRTSIEWVVEGKVPRKLTQ